LLYSHRHAFIFVKGLKVGGTSMEVALASQLEADAIVTPIVPAVTGHQPRNYETPTGATFHNHMTAAAIRERIGTAAFDRCTKWGIVRRPAAKVESYFYMGQAREGAHFSIDQAIEKCQSEQDRYCGPDGRLLLDVVLRYEQLSTTLPPLLASLGLDASPFFQTWAKAEYRQNYRGPSFSLSDEQRARIQEKFSFDESFYA
jgi:hypothetical protein